MTPDDLAAIAARAATHVSARAEVARARTAYAVAPGRQTAADLCDDADRAAEDAAASLAGHVDALLAHITTLTAERDAAASEASDLAARDAAMRGTLAAPSLATMRALHRAGGCWLVSYDDDDSGDPVVTIEYFDGARSLAEKEGDNPARWVAVDRCGRVCLPPQGDAADGAL